MSTLMVVAPQAQRNRHLELHPLRSIFRLQVRRWRPEQLLPLPCFGSLRPQPHPRPRHCNPSRLRRRVHTVSYRIRSTDPWAVCAEATAAVDALGPLLSECPHMARGGGLLVIPGWLVPTGSTCDASSFYVRLV
eukprot:scaffold26488_cov63-Phaeocystis_antarctica.AAC.2